MDDSTSLIFRFLMSGVGCGPTVKQEIASQQTLAQTRKISWGEYSTKIAALVSDKSLYEQLISYYRLQAVGWGLTILATSMN
jgi:hypothetical protein